MHRYKLFCHTQGLCFNQWIHASSKALTLSWRRFLSYRNQSIDLFCNQWTGFCIIGTSVMKDSRRRSSACIESLFLHVVKHKLLFLSMWIFFHEYLWFTEQQVKGEDISLYLFYHFYPLHRHLDISLVIAAESSPLHIAGSRNRTWNLCYTLFRIHSFCACTGSCCS